MLAKGCWVGGSVDGNIAFSCIAKRLRREELHVTTRTLPVGRIPAGKAIAPKNFPACVGCWWRAFRSRSPNAPHRTWARVLLWVHTSRLWMLVVIVTLVVQFSFGFPSRPRPPACVECLR